MTPIHTCWNFFLTGIVFSYLGEKLTFYNIQLTNSSWTQYTYLFRFEILLHNVASFSVYWGLCIFYLLQSTWFFWCYYVRIFKNLMFCSVVAAGKRKYNWFLNTSHPATLESVLLCRLFWTFYILDTVIYRKQFIPFQSLELFWGGLICTGYFLKNNGD